MTFLSLARSTSKPRKPRLARCGPLCGYAALVACLSLVGCSTPSGGSSGSKGWSFPWTKTAENKPVTYEQLAKDQQQRKINSPALGLDQSIEPNPIQTAASSMGANMKEGADKLTTAIRPKPDTSSQPQSKGLWPFSKPKQKEISPDFYVSIAQAYEQGKDFDRATAQYEKALSMDPKHLEAMLAYAHMEDRNEHVEKSIELYDRAMKAYPKDPRPANDLGLCYARHARYDEAIACLSKAIKLNPDKELYRNNVATVLVKMGRTDDAVEQISKVYGEAVGRYNVALLLNSQGNREAAIEQLAAAIAAKPDLKQAQEWLAQLTSTSEQEQFADAQPMIAPGPVAVASGVEEADMNRVPQLATPASATMETARSPRATGGQPQNLLTPTPRPRTLQNPSASAPMPPSPRVTQTSAAAPTGDDDSDSEAWSSKTKRAVLNKATASDDDN